MVLPFSYLDLQRCVCVCSWDDVCANQALNGRPRCNIYTPALDALAASGMRLMRHYTEPWCLPSRSSLLTGIAPARLGVNFVNMVSALLLHIN